MNIKRCLALGATVVISSAALSPAALAFDCGNSSKPIGPGEKAVVDLNGNPEWISKSWLNQVEHGKDPNLLHGGFIGIDVSGDGSQIVDTYANPRGEVPQTAQQNGAPCNGVTSIEQEYACRYGG